MQGMFTDLTRTRIEDTLIAEYPEVEFHLESDTYEDAYKEILSKRSLFRDREYLSKALTCLVDAYTGGREVSPNVSRKNLKALDSMLTGDDKNDFIVYYALYADKKEGFGKYFIKLCSKYEELNIGAILQELHLSQDRLDCFVPEIDTNPLIFFTYSLPTLRMHFIFKDIENLDLFESKLKIQSELYKSEKIAFDSLDVFTDELSKEAWLILYKAGLCSLNQITDEYDAREFLLRGIEPEERDVRIFDFMDAVEFPGSIPEAESKVDELYELAPRALVAQLTDKYEIAKRLYKGDTYE